MLRNNLYLFSIMVVCVRLLCTLHFLNSAYIFHTSGCGSQGAGGIRAGCGEGRVVWPLAFSTALSRSVGRSASQSPTLVFFVYFLFYSFNLSLRFAKPIVYGFVDVWFFDAKLFNSCLFWQCHVWNWFNTDTRVY